MLLGGAVGAVGRQLVNGIKRETLLVLVSQWIVFVNAKLRILNSLRY